MDILHARKLYFLQNSKNEIALNLLGFNQNGNAKTLLEITPLFQQGFQFKIIFQFIFIQSISAILQCSLFPGMHIFMAGIIQH